MPAWCLNGNTAQASSRRQPTPIHATTSTRWHHEMNAGKSGLEPDIAGSFQTENRTCFLRRGNLVAKLLEYPTHLSDLFGIRRGQFAAADIEVVLEADAHVAAHHRSLGNERELMATGRQHGPDVIGAEQLVGSATHEVQVVPVGADTPKNTEDGLDKEGRLAQLLVDEIGKVIEMPDVVALVLEPRAVSLVEQFHDARNVTERIAEDEVVGRAQVRYFPIVLPCLE